MQLTLSKVHGGEIIIQPLWLVRKASYIITAVTENALENRGHAREASHAAMRVHFLNCVWRCIYKWPQ